MYDVACQLKERKMKKKTKKKKKNRPLFAGKWEVAVEGPGR